MSISYLSLFLTVISVLTIGYLISRLYKAIFKKQGKAHLSKPYLFYKEDEALIKNITGLKKIKRIYENPHKPLFFFSLHPDSTIEEISNFVLTIPDEFEFKIDTLYNPSDKGILKFAFIHKEGNGFLLTQLNHGKQKKPEEITHDQLTLSLFNSRKYLENKLFSVYRRDK